MGRTRILDDCQYWFALECVVGSSLGLYKGSEALFLTRERTLSVLKATRTIGYDSPSAGYAVRHLTPSEGFAASVLIPP